MTLRKYPRIRVEFKITFSFSGGQTVGEGKLIDLSEGGCAIHSEKTLDKGTFLSFTISPPALDSPIRVDSAAVRWVKGREFGVEFLKMRPEEQERLRQLVQTLQTAEQAPS